MTLLKLDISMSLDGFVARPNASLERPHDEGGDRLHRWAFATGSFRRMHGLSSGETGIDDEIAAEAPRGVGATVMGRRMFSGGEGPWEKYPNADAWWGEEPPFHQPVFVLTHHAREPVPKLGGTTFTFVTEGIETALEQGAWGRRRQGHGRRRRRERRAAVSGGRAARRAPGSPRACAARRRCRLFDDHLTDWPGELRCTRVIESPTGVAHLRYEVVR